MKTARFMATLAVAALFTGAPANDVAAAPESNSTTPTATTPPPTAPTTNPNASPIDRIRSAADPSSAIDAYTRAQTANPGNLQLEKEYVHRMVELNVPELADAQAREIVSRGQLDGVAQAVTGYMAAAHGQP